MVENNLESDEFLQGEKPRWNQRIWEWIKSIFSKKFNNSNKLNEAYKEATSN